LNCSNIDGFIYFFGIKIKGDNNFLKNQYFILKYNINI